MFVLVLVGQALACRPASKFPSILSGAVRKKNPLPAARRKLDTNASKG